MATHKKKFSLKNIFLFLLILPLGILEVLADEEFDPFDPEVPDPGNADISQFVIVLIVFGLAFAGYKLRKQSE
jgi:hypothetical protein